MPDELPAFLRLLLSTARWRAVSVLVLTLAGTATEAASVLLLLPLLRLAGVAPAQGTTGTLADTGFRLLRALHVPPLLPAVLLLFALGVTARALIERAASVATMRLQEEQLLAMRVRLHRALTSARWEHLARTRGADLVHALTGELERQATAPTQVLNLIAGVLLVLVYLTVALLLSPVATVLAIASGGALVALLRAKRRAARRVSAQLEGLTHELFSVAAEHVHGVKTFKSNGVERRSEAQFAAAAAEVAGANVDVGRLFANVRVVFEVGSVVVLCIAVYAGVSVLALPAAAILMLLYVFTRLTPRLAAVQSTYQGLVLVMPSFGRVMRTIESCEDAAERVVPAAPAPRLSLCAGVVLEDVHFRYPDPLIVVASEGTPASGESAVRRPPALRGVTLDIPAGRTTAIVGPSGAGKSTVADILLGLLAPQRGTVQIDGAPLTPASVPAWRAAVGYVEQDAFLFHDTIRANLLWSRPESTEAELRDALALAAADFVMRLPRGLDTVVGDRGARLSGGERQRLALARALLRRPALLVLDETTSALDSENERRIQQAVESLHGSTTVLVITHRINAVRGADLIHVLEDGRVVESGAWSELLARGGRFADLARAHGITLRGDAAGGSRSLFEPSLAVGGA